MRGMVLGILLGVGSVGADEMAPFTYNPSKEDVQGVARVMHGQPSNVCVDATMKRRLRQLGRKGYYLYYAVDKAGQPSVQIRTRAGEVPPGLLFGAILLKKEENCVIVYAVK